MRVTTRRATSNAWPAAALAAIRAVPVSTLRPLAWALVALVAMVAPVGAFESAQPGAPTAAPASRQADKVAVITIKEPITSVTEYSIRRRLAEAESRGAQAVVFDIDTPGGDLYATLAICNAIKGGPIPTTVAWINPDAYSAGVFIALACREIVTAPYATLGDAAPIAIMPGIGLQSLPETERQKILAPVLVELVNSARRNAYDEKFVQGFLSLGAELWLVEDTRTGERYFIDEKEWRTLFDNDPPRNSPRFSAGATRGAGASTPDTQVPTDVLRPRARPTPGSPGAPGADASEFQPAIPGLTGETLSAVSQNLDQPSLRPQFTTADRGRFRLIEYTSDGTTLLTLKQDDLLRYGFSSGVIRTDEELKAFFGAKELVRLDKSLVEHLVSFLRNNWVRGALIAIFLLCMFLELIAPGVTAPGLIAGACLLALLAPPLLLGAAGWWTIAAVGAGVVLLLVELFVLPGMIIFGAAGVLLLLAGLVGSFVNTNDPRMGDQIVHGLAITLLATFVAAIGMYFVGRVYGSVPVLNRLVLSATQERPEEGDLLATDHAPEPGLVRVGEEGVATTPLRPAGSAQFGDAIIDVVSETGFSDSGTRVRVLSVTRYRVGVEALETGDRPVSGERVEPDDAIEPADHHVEPVEGPETQA